MLRRKFIAIKEYLRMGQQLTINYLPLHKSQRKNSKSILKEIEGRK